MNTATQQYAERMMEHDLTLYRRRFPDDWQARLDADPERVADWRAGHITKAEAVAESITSRSREFAERITNGALYPDNKATRQLFTALTGIELPRTVGGTESAIAADPVWGPLVADCRRERQEAEAERVKLAEAERMEREAAELAASRQRFAAGERVTGCELLAVARSIGIDVHPRTAGTLKSRVVEIGGGSARIRGGRCPDGVWEVYRAALALVSRECD